MKKLKKDTTKSSKKKLAPKKSNAKKPKGKVKKQPKATKAKASKAKVNKQKSVVERIREVIVTPAAKDTIPLVSPLPKKDVNNFGDIPFESQARLVFNTFPADEAEIIGNTEKSGAGTVDVPKVAGSS